MNKKKDKKQTAKEMLKFTKDLDAHLTEAIEMMEHGLHHPQVFSAGYEADPQTEIVALLSWAEDIRILAHLSVLLANIIENRAAEIKVPKSKPSKIKKPKAPKKGKK
jgi:hypothetical protein